MRFLFVTPRYHPHVGGVEYVVKSVAERLANKRHDVTVLCGEPSIDNPKEELINGVHVFRWPVWIHGDAYHIPRMRDKMKIWLLNALNGYDVIHFHSVHSVFTVFSLDVLKNCGIRKVLTPHYGGTGYTTFRRLLWWAWRSYVKRALDSVDLVHTFSERESKLILRNFGVKSVTIEPGVEEWLSEIDWSPSNYVMYGGRIERFKNIHRLANIVKILNDTGLDLELRIFGSGPYISKLVKYLKKLKISYEYKPPPKEYKEYIMHLSRALLVGLLSQRESYSLTVNEANAIGVPIMVVEPWGLNFLKRSRTLITQLSKSDEAIAKDIVLFLEGARKEPRSEIPSWNQLLDIYIKRLYSSQE
jgi:1,2-diacylglycerol 3-alpha-glucosyltransferase